MMQTLDRLETLEQPTCDVPLCVDLDGTLIRTDLVQEGLARLLRRPWIFAVALWQLIKGRAALKHWLATNVPIAPESLPYREDLLLWLRNEKVRGRWMVLATGADITVAETVARHLDIFDEVIASNGNRNLTGPSKAERLSSRFGVSRFDYVGDSDVDTAVWDVSRMPIRVPLPTMFARVKAFIRGIRVRQWVKNVLVFVPLLTSHGWFQPASVIACLEAFAALSLCASAIYILNDLLDLDSDRRHATKRRRPFASGALSILTGLAAMPVLLAAAVTIAMQLPTGARVLLGAYLGITTVYSIYLKRKLLVDVFALSLLYTLRVLLGGAASGVDCSPWLIAFSVFIFMSLAFCKRAAELANLRDAQRQRAAGRDYFVWDLAQLNVFGVSSGYLAAIVLALYIHSPEVRLLYRGPEWLWALVPVVAYWISRTWILASRGAMNEDPIVFATRDRVTYLCGIIAAGCMTLAVLGGVHIPGVAR